MRLDPNSSDTHRQGPSRPLTRRDVLVTGAAGIGLLLLRQVPGSQAVAASASRHAAAKKATSGHKSSSVSIRTAVTPTKPAASLGPLENIPQTLNNCGPASVAEVLAYWRIYWSQEQVQAVLRADNNPRGMAPYGLPLYARTLGMRAMIGPAGSERLIKALISNGFPVIVSQWVSSGDQIRHYRPIEAYDDRLGHFVSSDPYLGAGHVISYADFNAIWSVSNKRFLVIYPRSRQSQVQAVLVSAGWSYHEAYVHELAWQQAMNRDPAIHVPHSWLWHNGYVAAAWDEAQLGHYRKANAYLKTASEMGISPVLIGWVRQQL